MTKVIHVGVHIAFLSCVRKEGKNQNEIYAFNYNIQSNTRVVSAVFDRALLCKHAILCQYCADTRPMLAASGQYRHSTGMFTGGLLHLLVMPFALL